jgi:hypothetical protein
LLGFDELWRYIAKRGCITVQEYHELQFVYNLISGCASYLEIGTAEGNSMYVLAHALAPNARITYVDFGEKHTTPYRCEIVAGLETEGYRIMAVLGDSHDQETISKARALYDVVLIDAGHKFEDVIQDARNYGKMATRFIIFHDINLPEVSEAFDLYKKETGHKAYRISNSETFGYGILEVK